MGLILPPPAGLRLASYNVRKAVGLDRRRDPDESVADAARAALVMRVRLGDEEARAYVLADVEERPHEPDERYLALLEDLPAAVLEGAPSTGEPQNYHEQLNQTKRDILLKALRAEGSNYARAAERLGLQRTYLHRLVTKLGLRDLLGAE